MVGNQKRSMGMVADVRDRGGKSVAGAVRGDVVTTAAGSEDESWQIAPGTTRLLTTRTDPPPKHKDNNRTQPDDIGRESAARATQHGTVSASSIESGSGSAAVGALDAARRRRGQGAPNWRACDHSHGRASDAAVWLARLAPATLPPGCERTVNDDQSKWYRVRLAHAPLGIILEIEIWQGELWAHLAITGRTAKPIEAEVTFCRDLFLGDRTAIQIFPTRLERAEAGDRTVHLYAPLESAALPSFSRSCEPRFPEG